MAATTDGKTRYWRSSAAAWQGGHLRRLQRTLGVMSRSALTSRA